MRDYSKISPKFWTGLTGRSLRKCGMETQFLALYLLTSPHANMTGIYYLPIEYIVHDTGRSQQEILKAFTNLQTVNFCRYDENTEHV